MKASSPVSIPRNFCVVPINNLAGSDMKITVFIESDEINDPEIDKLITAVKLLDGLEVEDEIANRFSEEAIYSFFANPLAKVYGVGKYQGHHDHEGTYVLYGKFVFPDSILPKKNLTKSDKGMKKRWEDSVLQCTKFPEWKNVCERVEQI